MSSTVSIIVPVYNSEKYIHRCIDSIINQSYKDIEIIVIDDGSIDGSVDIINNYAKQDHRINLYTQQNSGPSLARNYGLSIASGKYITFCDSDDYLEYNYIQQLIQSIEQLDVDIVSSGYIDISKYGTIKLNDFYNGKPILSKQEFVDSIFKGVGGTLWGKIFKKEIISKYNLKLNPNIYMCEDMIFVLQYSMLCKSFGAIEQNLYNYYRLNDESISKKMNISYYKNLIEVLEEIETILKVNDFDVNYIDKILSNRIKNMLINLLIIQNDKEHNYSKEKKIENIKYLINSKYSQKYVDKFDINSIKERIMINLIVNKKYNELSLYSNILYSIQKIKDKIRGID